MTLEIIKRVKDWGFMLWSQLFYGLSMGPLQIPISSCLSAIGCVFPTYPSKNAIKIKYDQY